MRADAPSQSSIAPLNFFISASVAFITARNPDIPTFPAMASALADFSASVIFANASRQSLMISFKSLMVPSAFCVSTTHFPNELPENSTTPWRLVIIVRIAVPAIDALIPLFAINPNAVAVSSMEYPNAPAMGPQYLNDSPSIDTLVFALDDAAAKTSAKCPASPAFNPNAVRASVTISEVVPRLSPEAAARLRIPSIPSSISPVFHPAIAI